MPNDKSKESISNNSPVTSSEDVLDKKRLFSKLVRVQYPMAQDVPISNEQEPNNSNMGYHAHMEELIEKYKYSY